MVLLDIPGGPARERYVRVCEKHPDLVVGEKDNRTFCPAGHAAPRGFVLDMKTGRRVYEGVSWTASVERCQNGHAGEMVPRAEGRGYRCRLCKNESALRSLRRRKARA